MHGRAIDLSDEQARDRAERLAARHGCKLRQHGRAWLVTGPNVSLVISDLRALALGDLVPAGASSRGR
jgi:hypothetical protein